jgi:hypothetical protein
LETPPRTGLTVLLALHHAGIAGKVAAIAKAHVVALVNLTEGAGKSMPACTGLTVRTAAVHVDKHIKLILTGYDHEGLPNHYGMFT